MKLLHYSEKPFTFDPAHSYGDKGVGHGKPPGFWVSVAGDDDWRAWCEAEQWGLSRLTHAHEVTLQPDAKILRLADALDLDVFTERHGEPDRRGRRGDSIRWDDVKREHQGIIIAPYVWKRRLDLMWYYGWDCASGVIWDLGAVASVQPVETEVTCD